jgi:hypothetical protein
MRGGLVDDDAHRAFWRMGAEVDDAPGEALVGEARHGDQNLAVEIEALAMSFLEAPGHTGMLGIAAEFSTRDRVSEPTSSRIFVH